jgi:hypothetical protein
MQPNSYNELVYMTRFLNEAAELKQRRGTAEEILREQKELLLTQQCYICVDCHLLHALRKDMLQCQYCDRYVAYKIKCRSHLAIKCRFCSKVLCKTEFINCDYCNTQICKECATFDRLCVNCV